MRSTQAAGDPARHAVFPEPEFADINGIRLAYYACGPMDGLPVILCHGWPEIAYSWRLQMQALAEAGFRAIAPDMRGFGRSVGPQGRDAVAQYDVTHLAADLVGLLDHLCLGRAVFVGHDWGGFVTWDMPLRHRDRVIGVIGVNTPYIPRPAFDPVQFLRRVMGERMYMVEFQTYGRGEDVLAHDTARSLAMLVRKSHITQAQWSASDPRKRRLELLHALDTAEEYWPGEPLLSDADMQIYVDAYTKSGWEGGINWYRNISRNWATSAELPKRIDVPALMIHAANDVVLSPRLGRKMPRYIADLETHVIEDCGHWTQIEKPDELNAIMIKWLTQRFVETRATASKFQDK
jgi:pimeloyl-ACP methyl ester carboxylesterase